MLFGLFSLFWFIYCLKNIIKQLFFFKKYYFEIMKIIKSVFVLSSILVIGQAMPIKAQSENDCFTKAKRSGNLIQQLTELGRAQNLARQAGEEINGGIGKYRAETSMFGPMDATNCVVSGDNTWTFTFTGSTADSSVPIVETVVTVNNETWDVVVDSNTPLNN